MQNYVSFVKRTLTAIIEEMSHSPCLFVRNPGLDFSRKRKLDFKSFLDFFMTMEGKSLGTELLEYFDYAQDTITVSAFNQLHLIALYDICNRTYMDAFIQNRAEENEFRACVQMVERTPLECGNVILFAGRGYENYNLFAHAQEKGWKFLIRAKDIHSNGILSGIRGLTDGCFDTELSFLLTRRQTNEIKTWTDTYKFMLSCQKFDYLPPKSKDTYPMRFRAVRFLIGDDSYECIITNLPAEEFQPEDIKNLYHMH